MKRTLALLAALVVGLAVQANATLMDLGLQYLPGSLGSPGNEAWGIANYWGTPGEPIYLNKLNNGPEGWDNGGALASSYFSVLFSPGSKTAEISWDLTGTGWQVDYVLLKSGVNPATHLQTYHLYGVAADQTVVGGGTVEINGSKQISHISFFGGHMVPDGGTTMVLLGLGLAGLSLARRFSRK